MSKLAMLKTRFHRVHRNLEQKQPMRHNSKDAIQEHYDVMSPYYQELWGEHIHHGYWIKGDESKERAQVQLMERLAQAAGIQRGAKILDVGCGFGGASIHLAKTYNAEVTGITISPVQVEMATKAAAGSGLRTRFLLMDAEAMKFDELFDVVWSVESISHYRDTAKFFCAAAKLLKPGGTFAVTDWFKREGLTARDERKFIAPIESSMMLELRTMGAYEKQIEAAGLRILSRETLTEQCEKTWDLALDIIGNKKLWAIAARHGKAFVAFLRGFRAMRAGFRSASFVYGMLVAKATE